jgi:hypothetical protein
LFLFRTHHFLIVTLSEATDRASVPAFWVRIERQSVIIGRSR